MSSLAVTLTLESDMKAQKHSKSSRDYEAIRKNLRDRVKEIPTANQSYDQTYSSSKSSMAQNTPSQPTAYSPRPVNTPQFAISNLYTPPIVDRQSQRTSASLALSQRRQNDPSSTNVFHQAHPAHSSSPSSSSNSVPTIATASNGISNLDDGSQGFALIRV